MGSKNTLDRSATIRNVPSLDDTRSSPKSKNSGGPSPDNKSNTSPSSMGGSQMEGSPNAKSREETNGKETPSRWSAQMAAPRVVEPTPQEPSTGDDGGDQPDGWDSTVGKAGLGKTGRVINKLVSDNDALKRDLQIERLRAEESKQAAKLIEDKMERMVSEYEGRLLEANVAKTLLARKERQVETLQSAVDLEKKKTEAALQRERNWRDELEKIQSQSAVQVDEATAYAALMEGRYNTISSHWKNQGEEVGRAMSKMRQKIRNIVEERRADDVKIQTLRDLCEQQDNNITQLWREKEAIARKFEEYKQLQDDDLRDIRENAKAREEEQERILEESREALNKLNWALNVKKNVKGAQ